MKEINILKTEYQKKIMASGADLIDRSYANYFMVNEIVKKRNTNKVQIIENDLHQRYIDLSFIQYFEFNTQTLLMNINLSDVDFVYLNILRKEEIDQEVVLLINALANKAVIINNKMDWVPHINANFSLMKDVNLALVELGVRPYGLFIPLDNVKEGIDILDRLRGWSTGLAVPHLITVDKNGDKKHVLPNYLVEMKDENYIFRNYKKINFDYRNK